MENQKLMSKQNYKFVIFFNYYFGSFDMMQWPEESLAPMYCNEANPL